MTTTPAQRIFLSMIVKDEAPVIARCLRALRPFIDSWCIVDTGSSAATPKALAPLLAAAPPVERLPRIRANCDCFATKGQPL